VKPLRRRYPDFLGIGAQKAGTTWLHRNLASHPQIWLPPVKEVHYFDEVHIKSHKRWTSAHRQNKGSALLRGYLARTPAEERRPNRIALLETFVEDTISDDWYGRLFGFARPAQICGEFTPEYSIMREKGIQHVLQLSPDVKLILSLRDPIERCWSQIRMTDSRQRGSGLAELEEAARSPSVLGRSDYPGIVSRWSRFVPEERLHIVFMDDIAEKPLQVLSGVCGFLGLEFLPERFTDASVPIHPGNGLDMPPTVYESLKRSLRYVYDQLVLLYPQHAGKWMARHY